MATAAWLGQAGMDAASARHVPASRAFAEARQAAALARKIGGLLNQAVAALHATGTPPGSLEAAARAAARAQGRLDDAVLALLDKQ